MEEYGKKLDEMNSAVESALPEGEECFVYYSVYNMENGLPVNNLHEVAVEGKVIFTQNHDGFWGAGISYQSDVIENPTWLDVAVLANEMIKIVGDYHHIFLEGVSPVYVATINTYVRKVVGDVQYYEFDMGS